MGVSQVQRAGPPLAFLPIIHSPTRSLLLPLPALRRNKERPKEAQQLGNMDLVCRLHIQN